MAKSWRRAKKGDICQKRVQKISFGGMNLTQTAHATLHLDPPSRCLAEVASTPVMVYNCQSNSDSEKQPPGTKAHLITIWVVHKLKLL